MSYINGVKMMEAGCMIGAPPNSPAATTPTTVLDRLCDFWNERIMERFIKANLFLICCIAAALLLIGYLAAFSCEVSWILEARGELPNSAYVLCTQYFIVFVATTILIHGLVTGLSWGLFAWSVIIGILSIPELFFVMVMTTQHWGLQSVHGLTELISYLIRLVINCFALICVIPTGLKWRRESQVLSQLQNLATRLQLQTPPPSVPIAKGDSRRASKRSQNNLNITSFDNAGYVINEAAKQHHGSQQFFQNNSAFGSQNEFNASVFAPASQQYSGPARGNRAQSLMDLRCTLPGLYNPRYVIENEDHNSKYFNITVDDLKNSLNDSKKQPIGTEEQNSIIGSVAADPIYCTIDAAKPQKLSRNCVSLENLDGIAKVQRDYGNNLLQNYEQQYYLAMMGHPINYNPHQHQLLLEHLHRHHHNPRRSSKHLHQSSSGQRHNMMMNGMVGCGGIGYGGYTNPFAYNAPGNSKLSLGNESDDYRKYRDVAL
ncbi:uncharacterized protein LOC129921045 [Episyrphus balteatus]|uniref:uncharacterized protein LOC129921045 n=1 Tax=Episyrphus balteatus TaxID=286459 RepID=UPI0024854079|nr:uncharacterized protein LOC129921045 [Episyrphus balteatus]